MDLSMLPARIAKKIRVDAESGCWLWQAATDEDGYGRAYMPGGNRAAHRVVYELLIGEIPFGHHLDHVKERGCISNSCVKAIADEHGPAHLEPVGWTENNRRAGLGRRKDACVRGHLMAGENAAINPASGKRYCRECNKERAKEWRAKDPKGYRESLRRRYRTPEGQQWLKEYRSRPEVLAREAERMRRVRAQRRIDGKLCSVDGCERPAASRGLCSTDYNRWWKQNRKANR